MSKWTEATRIPPETRREVFSRDFNRCVGCESSYRLECAHIVPRRQGGKGIKTNLVTLCHTCHQKMDYYSWTDDGKEIERRVMVYIKILYPGWTEEDQTYHKYD